MLSERRVHTTLPSRDPGQLRRFYEDVLGFAPLAELEGAMLYQAGDGSLFALSRTSITARGGHHPDGGSRCRTSRPRVAELGSPGVAFETYESPKTVDGIARIGPGRAAWFKDREDNLIGLSPVRPARLTSNSYGH